MTTSKPAMASPTRIKLTHSDYGVAIISPLEVEMSAVRYMLDEEHECPRSNEEDPNHYICGKMSGHNVVIAYLPEGLQGIGAAATVAVHMKRSFPSAALRLLVGIGGGVPSDVRDIRLGDVVVSMPSGTHGGIVQYDLGKETVDSFERKGMTDPPDPKWRSAVVELQSDHRTRDNFIPGYIETMIKQHPGLASYRRPPSEGDVLFQPIYRHPRTELSCRACDSGQKVNRASRPHKSPTIFYGLIASGNRVIKNAVTRDRIAREVGGALCFEMEAVGLMHDFRCIVVRGISDYADSHKNDEWHPYAAATAAGYVKELLTYVKANTVGNALLHNQYWGIGRASNPWFTGRDMLISEIRQVVQTNVIDHVQDKQCVIVLAGVGGQGKTEICLRLATVMRPSFWGVFWADVSSHTTAEGDFLAIGQQLALSLPDIDNVRRHLANTKRPWLLILDNADDTNVDYRKYFPVGSLGVILLTSRNPECLQYATDLCDLCLEGLSDKDAGELLMKTAQIQEHQRESHRHSAEKIAVSLFHGHPLAIVQAGAYLSRGHCSLAQYPTIFEKQRQRLLTYRPKRAQSRYSNVYTTFEASADMLMASHDQTAEDALQLLSVVSMFATCQLPLSLFEQAWIGGRQILHETGENWIDDERVERLVPWHVWQLLPLLEVEYPTRDSFRLIEALQLLEQYSIVTVSGRPQDTRLLMHPLASAWAFDRQSMQQKQESWMRAACTIALSSVRSEIWVEEGMRLRPHLRALLLTQSDVIFDDRPQLMLVRVLLHCGWLSQALRLDVEVLRLSQQIFHYLNLDDQNLHKQWIFLYKLIASTLRRCGQSERAIPLLKQILIAERSLPPTHSSRVSSEYELANAYRSNGQFTEASQVMEHVVSILETVLEADDETRLTAEHNLAVVRHSNRQIRQAVTLLEHIVSIRTRTLGRNHPVLRMTHYSLAIAYLRDKQTGRAVKLLEDFVNEFAQSLSKDHPCRIASGAKLAWAYHVNGQAERGVTLLRAMISNQEVPVQDSPDGLVARKIYAIMLWEQHRKSESFEMMERTVAACQQHLNPQNLQRKSAEAWLSYMRSQTCGVDCNSAGEARTLDVFDDKFNNPIPEHISPKSEVWKPARSSNLEFEHAPPDPELGCYIQGIDYMNLIRLDDPGETAATA